MAERTLPSSCGVVWSIHGQSRVIVEKWCAQLRGFENRPGEIVVCAGVRYMLIPAGKSLMIVGGECRDEPFWGRAVNCVGDIRDLFSWNTIGRPKWLAAIGLSLHHQR
jgi:hypothetical protein